MADLISDLTVYGQGSAMEIHLYIYLQFKGQEQSTAELTFTLFVGGGPTPKPFNWMIPAATDCSTMIAHGL